VFVSKKIVEGELYNPHPYNCDLDTWIKGKCRQAPKKNDGSRETEGTKGIRRLSYIINLVSFNI